MRISRFFIVFTAIFLIELLLLGVMAHPTVPLVFLCALSALAAVSLPWYAYLYLLIGVSLSAFLQSFSLFFTGVGFGGVTVLSIVFRDMLEHHLIVQSALAITGGLVFMGLMCTGCLTLWAVCVTVLIVPCMIKLLQ